MSTSYYFGESNFKIVSENFSNAILALREWVKEEIEHSEKVGLNSKYEGTLELSDQDFFERIADIHNWKFEINDNGIHTPYFYEMFRLPNIDWLDAMSFYIEDSSFIELSSDNDYKPRWRHVWRHGNKSKEIEPVWPEVE
jgi:hypothetical protein